MVRFAQALMPELSNCDPGDLMRDVRIDCGGGDSYKLTVSGEIRRFVHQDGLLSQLSCPTPYRPSIEAGGELAASDGTCHFHRDFLAFRPSVFVCETQL
jgi:hypothetical protein